MRRILALFKKSKCCRTRCYFNGINYACGSCNGNAKSYRLPRRETE